MKILIIGYGKMGHEIENVALQRSHEVVATIDNAEEWQQFDRKKCSVDVAIEFSQPAQALFNLNQCFSRNIPVVCGTTGWYSDLDSVIQQCKTQNQSLFYSPNFSIGMNITFMLARQLDAFAQRYHYDIHLSETHHIHKLDKPSGTAVKMAEDILKQDARYKGWSLENNETDKLFVEVHRQGEVFGIHSLTAQSDCDKISLTHEAFSRQGFAIGAVIAAEFLIGKKGCFTMQDLLQN